MSIVIGQFLVFFCIYIYRCCNYCCCVGIEKDIDLYMVFVLYMQNYMILEKKDILCVNYCFVNYYFENIFLGY